MRVVDAVVLDNFFPRINASGVDIKETVCDC